MHESLAADPLDHSNPTTLPPVHGTRLPRRTGILILYGILGLAVLGLFVLVPTGAPAAEPVPDVEIARREIRAEVEGSADRARIREKIWYIVNTPGRDSKKLETVAVPVNYLMHPRKVRVELHRTDGSWRQWRTNEFAEVPLSAAAASVTDASLLILSLPRLGAGDTLSIEKNVDMEPFIGFSLFLLGDEQYPSRAVDFELKIPESLQGRVRTWNVPDETIRAETERWSIALRDVPALPREDLAPTGPDLLPVVSVGLARMAWGSSSTWEELGVSYWDRVRERTAPPASLDRMNSRRPEARQDSLDATLDLVQSNVRYLSVQLGEGGWIPTPAEEVLRRRYGDCKDMATLLLSLLGETGATGSLALVQTRPPAGLTVNPLPSLLVFNHMVVAAQNGDSLAWLDATDPYGTPDSPRWDIQGAPALVVNGDHTGYVRIPHTTASHNRRLRSIRARNTGGERWELTVEGSLSGAWASRFRGETVGMEPEEVARLLASGLSGDFRSRVREEIVLEDLSWGPDGARFRVKLAAYGLMEREEDTSRFVSPLGEPAPFFSVFKKRRRVSDVVWPIRVTALDTLLVEVPDAASPVLPDTTWVESAAGISVSGSQRCTDGEFRLTRSVQLEEITLPADRWEDGRRLNRLLVEWSQRTFSLAEN